MQALLLSCYWWGNGRSKGLGNLSKITQLTSVKIQPQVCCLWGTLPPTTLHGPPPIRSCPHGPRLGSAANCWAVGPGNSSLGGKAYAWRTLPLVYKSPFMYDITDGRQAGGPSVQVFDKGLVGGSPSPIS